MTSTWLNGARWDLTWIVGSAVVVPLGLYLVSIGVTNDAMNFAVTALIGGPHLLSTFLTTYFDPAFRRRHWRGLVAVAVLVPSFVVAMTLTRFQWLLSFFIFAASLHVLQQNAYLADCYRRKAGQRDPAWSRWLDYALLFLSFYPIASFKLVGEDFRLGDTQILIPTIARTPLTYWSISIAFGVVFVAWSAKTLLESRRGALNGPKTLLILVTTVIAFFVPAAASGKRLELAFQTVNTWHSIQYLGVIWLVLKLRKERGLIESKLVSAVSGPGRAAWGFYGLLLAVAGAYLAAVYGLIAWDPLGITVNQYYYMGILSALLIHYALDTYLFFTASRPESRPDAIPFAAPVRG